MNVLVDNLVLIRSRFVSRITVSVLIVTGYTLLVAVDLRLALAVWLLAWGAALAGRK